MAYTHLGVLVCPWPSCVGGDGVRWDGRRAAVRWFGRELVAPLFIECTDIISVLIVCR